MGRGAHVYSPTISRDTRKFYTWDMKNYLEKRREELRKRDGGFTLMEMLIVVAIIAVLIAIAIPVFTGQLENSREATDAANIRSAYAEVAAAALTTPDEDASATVTKVQTVDDWQNESIKNIAGIEIKDLQSTDDTEIEYEASAGKITIDGNEATTTSLDGGSGTDTSGSGTDTEQP